MFQVWLVVALGTIIAMETVVLGDDECPRGFELYGDKCYQFRRHSTAWGEAKRDCRYRGGKLASIRSQEELDYLKNQTMKRRITYWIGVDRINGTTGVGRWSDSTPWNHLVAWDNFNASRPLPSGTCGQILSTGAFRAELCSRQAASICKRDKPYCGCQNGGTCDLETEGCMCPRGFYGRKCQISQDMLCNKAHHIELDEPFRSTGVEHSPGDQTHCDKNNITSGKWYRFTSPAGAFMPQRCPIMNVCGVKYPVWLDGSIPTVDQGLVRRQACVRMRTDCCERELSIRVINCTTFPIYYLKPTSSCDIGYCAGTEVRCPIGTVSTTGFTPGCIDLRQIRVYAHRVFNETTNQFHLECHVDPLDEHMDKIVYDLEWVTDTSVQLDKEFMGKSSLIHILKEEKLHGQMGRKIKCRASPKLAGTSGQKHSLWIDSDYVFIGIKVLPESIRRTTECSSGLTVRIQSTVPFLCDSGPRRCNLTLNVILENEDSYGQNNTCLDGKNIVQAVLPYQKVPCGVILDSSEWAKTESTHSITIVPRKDFQYDGSQRVKLRFLGFDMPSSQLWHGYRIAEDVNAVIDDCDKPTLCSSFSDPHIRTFMGQFYDNFLEGEFVMYRNRKFSIQVNVRYKRCNNYASCTCGMSVKVRDELFVLDLCKQTTKTLWGPKKVVQIKRIEHHSRCGNVPWLKVTKTKDSKIYKICFKETGGHITVSTLRQSMNVYIFPAMHADLQQTEGLCGSLNNFTDDSKWRSLTMRNGSLYGTLNESNAQRPDTFSLEWRARPEELIWKSKCVSMPHHLPSYCQCASHVAAGMAAPSSCQPLYDLETCGACDGDVEISTYIKKKKVPTATLR